MRWFDVLRLRRKNIKTKLKVWKVIEEKTVSEYQEKFKLVGLDLTEKE